MEQRCKVNQKQTSNGQPKKENQNQLYTAGNKESTIYPFKPVTTNRPQFAELLHSRSITGINPLVMLH